MKSSEDYEQMDSALITKMRFPLIFAIVLFHARFQNVNFSDANIMLDTIKWYDVFTYSFESIGHIGVPLFYIISGYLFFYKNVSFGGLIYKRKIKKRVKSLLIPYFIWNVYSLLLILLASLVVPQYMSGRHNILNDFSVSELLQYFYAIDGNNPINGPLWFVRDLMIVTLCSPVIYYVIKKLCLFFLSILGLLWFTGFWGTNICGLYGFSSSAFLFFSIGAAFSIKHKYLSKYMSIWGGKIFPLYIFVNVFDNLTRGLFPYHELVHNICILLGIIAFIKIMFLCVNNNKALIFDKLSDYSFFLYCYHATVAIFLKKIALKLVDFQRSLIANLELLFFYVLIVFLIVVVGYGLYCFARRFFPSFTKVLMGAR